MCIVTPLAAATIAFVSPTGSACAGALEPDQPLASPAAQQAAAPPCCAAHQFRPQQRRELALDALAGVPLAVLARQNQVSRKFVRNQLDIARDALDRAFVTDVPDDDKVLFHLPVTQSWLDQLSLSLVLTCHSSLRGVHEILRDLFDFPRSVASIHSLVARAIATASKVNAEQDLNRVLEAALDEIFQGRKPILSVVDVASTYCCLLSLEDHRDGETWGVRLLELQERGFSPMVAVGDLAGGMRLGLELALPGLGCRADNFHVVRDVGQVVRFLQNRAYAAIAAYDKLHHKATSRSDDSELRGKRDAAKAEMQRAIALADDVAVLADWLAQEVLSVGGPSLAVRQMLYDFVLEQMQARVPGCEHRLKPVCGMLKRHKEELLDFVADIDRDISLLARYARVPEALLREMVAVQEMPDSSSRRWQRDAVLRQQLGRRYHELSQMVESVRKGVVRASSVVENLNSRIRNYLFLRKEVGQGYLELLRFYLNHHRFLRSEHPEREGKSPAELLSEQKLGHWLEMLGYQLFRRSA